MAFFALYVPISVEFWQYPLTSFHPGHIRFDSLRSAPAVGGSFIGVESIVMEDLPEIE